MTCDAGSRAKEPAEPGSFAKWILDDTGVYQHDGYYHFNDDPPIA